MTWQPWTARPVIGRAVHELVDDPARSDELIATLARCSAPTVARARAKLVSIGLVQHVPVADRTPQPRPGQPSATRDAIAILGPDAPAREVARLAGVSIQAAHKMLRSHSAASLPDIAAASDQLAVRASAECERCGAPFTFRPRPNRPARRWCSADCRRPVREPQAHRPPPIIELPDPPDFSKGTCTHVPQNQALWWTSDNPFMREAAAQLCLGCPLLVDCAEWSMHLPARDGGVYGGLTAADRRAIRAGDLP